MNGVIKRKCSGTCGRILVLNNINFYKHIKCKNGLTKRCKKCSIINKPRKQVKNTGIIKKCSGICGLELDLNSNNFVRSKKYKDGFRDQCRNCQGKGTPSKIIIENGIKYQICTLECKLKKELNSDNFHWRNNRNKFELGCRVCRNKKNLENSKKNKKERQIYNSNPKNKKRRNLLNKKRRKEKGITIQQKIRENISGAICKAFKKRNSKKSRSISKSLPYTIDELITHLEMWFNVPGNEWMTLNNNGVYNLSTWDNNDSSTWRWHLDHIIADVLFNYTSEDDQEFKDCWSLDNLRPLRADLNVSEGARRPRY